MVTAVPAPAVIVMGVSGSGKSFLGRLLAERCGWTFIEGDNHHSPGNLQKMAGGIPLTDFDRDGWLASIAEAILRAPREIPVVVSCSALKRRYRDRLRRAGRPVVFLHLTADADVLERRLDTREGHFMRSVLLQSQLEDLEPPDADEPAVTLDADQPPERLLQAAIASLRTYTGSRPRAAGKRAPSPEGGDKT